MLFQNEFYWIQRIVTKSKNGIVTTNFAYLGTARFLVTVIEIHFPYYLWVGIYCQQPHLIDTYPGVVNSLLLLHHIYYKT